MMVLHEHGVGINFDAKFTLHRGSEFGWSPLPALRHSVRYCPQDTEADLVSTVH
jgi:hypothetical protein